MSIFTPRILTRERITTALENAVNSYPLVVLTAPMGYGKTTAARELIGTLRHQVFHVGVTPGPHNALYLWDMAFSQLAAQGSKIASAMRSMGFPADSMRLQHTFEQGRAYLASRPTLLVVDDYHCVTDPAMDALLEALSREAMPNFHILLLSRARPNMALEDMRVKGIATLFDQTMLTFTKEEACAYFALHDTADAATAECAWKYSEGWAAALWLGLQSCRAHGTVTPAHDLETLLSETVFMNKDATDRVFLLQLSILDSFTAGQAIAISANKSAPRRLRELHRQNAFLSYDPASECYQLHSIFRAFLEKQLAELPEEQALAASVPCSSSEHVNKPDLYRRAGEWFAVQGDPVQAIRFFFRAGRDEDLLRILELFAVPSDGLFVMFDPQGLLSMLQAVPWQVRLACPVGWLSFIYHYMSRVSLEKGLALLDEAAVSFAADLSLSPTVKRHVAGEVELIRGIGVFNDLFAMREQYAKAHTLLQGCSRISHPQLVWTFGSPHVAYQYLREAGSYKKMVQLVEDNLWQYQELTGGCSAGAQELFRSELLLETGKTRQPEVLLTKAAYKAMAKKQVASLIAINFTMSRLLLYRGKTHEARDLILNMLPGILQTGNPLLLSSFDMCQGYLAAIAGYTDEIPLWLRQGEVATVTSFYQGAGFALIVHGKALLATGDWPRLEALAEEIPSQLGPYRNLFGRIHAKALHSIAALNLYGEEQALPLLYEAVALARPDGILLSIAEYGEYLLPLVQKMRVRGQRDAFLDALKKMARAYTAKTNPPMLAPQEQSALEKAIKGLNNAAIAQDMGLSPGTVRNTLSRAYQKLGVKNRLQASLVWKTENR